MFTGLIIPMIMVFARVIMRPDMGHLSNSLRERARSGSRLVLVGTLSSSSGSKLGDVQLEFLL